MISGHVGGYRVYIISGYLVGKWFNDHLAHGWVKGCNDWWTH